MAFEGVDLHPRDNHQSPRVAIGRGEPQLRCEAYLLIKRIRDAMATLKLPAEHVRANRQGVSRRRCVPHPLQPRRTGIIPPGKVRTDIEVVKPRDPRNLW